ncbi:MAG: UvrD-helicase domain-containing protein, partial [Lachnospiraceae bacterium]|nr:UvrD-helicase domain-containing protein [Lachnospiraceae bacterium]
MTFKDFKNRLSISLNDQQWEAVRAVEGPILLIAVPGSGKTTVLVTRIGFLIGCCGIPSQNILTITYTKAAAADMKRRFAAIFSAKMAERLSFQTINSLCFEIIHRSGQMDGVQVASEKDILEILTGIFQKYIGDYPTESDLQSLQTQISYIKNMMLGNDEIRKLGDNDAVPLLRIFEDYNSLLHQSDRMDFDDQMVYAYQILRQNPQLLSYYQHKYRYFCVDEAQDTSKIQHIIIALLASKDRNLFMVGDEDQSIYGFRAAY